jgi:hypothetical protein
MTLRRSSVLALALVAMVAFGVASCGKPDHEAGGPEPAQVKPITGSVLHLVTLSPLAMRELGVETQPVRATATAGGGTTTVIPLTAVIYDPAGKSWAYTVSAPRTFVRRAIVIDHMDGDVVFLRSGPPVGAPVVTVGDAELLGAEYGVGEE